MKKPSLILISSLLCLTNLSCQSNSKSAETATNTKPIAAGEMKATAANESGKRSTPTAAMAAADKVQLNAIDKAGTKATDNAQPKANETAADNASDKASEANLTMSEAEERSKAISNIHYGLQVELVEDSATFNAKFTAKFESNASTTFLDLQDTAKVHSVKVNGQNMAVDFTRHRLQLVNLAKGVNEIEIDYTQVYSHDGRGLHQFKDPEDGRVYLYTQFEAYDAHWMFPCFDQPDLKAKLTMQVKAPKDWEVITTTRETEKKVGGKYTDWSFPETPMLSTYLFSLHSGPYHKWESSAGKLRLRLFARKSLAKYVKTKDWFTPTKAGLAFYGAYFDYPFPFLKYDQIIAPGFNAGAMENVAAVTFSEWYVNRGDITRENRERLASVILHEMAHMWFGDLVTMKWWNGLWLNESFATFMAAHAMYEVTEFKESWQSFYTSEKSWAYWEDQLVTTHPIDGIVKDTDSAFSTFDGITYGKGASVMKQLRFYIGDQAFRNGVRSYFKAHAYKNTQLSDFMDELAKSSKKDLDHWSDTWLKKEGLDSVFADYQCKSEKIESFNLELKGPEGDSSPRVHRTKVGIYNLNGKDVALTKLVSVEYSGKRTPVTELIGERCPDFVYPNDQDEDYVKVRLDSRSLVTIQSHLNSIKSEFTRNLIWPNLYEMVRDAELPAAEYLKILLASVPSETSINVVNSMLGRHRDAFYYLPNQTTAQKAERTVWIEKMETLLWSLLQKSKPGSDWQKTFHAKFTDIAESEKARTRLVNLLTGKEALKGLTLDTDRRWQMLVRLASLGDTRADEELAKQKQADTSERGIQMAMQADAARPSVEVKREWFKKVVESDQMPFERMRMALRSFYPNSQEELKASLADDFYKNLPKVISQRDYEFQNLYSESFAPTDCGIQSSERLANFLSENGKDLPASVSKTLRISLQENQRCVKVRTKVF